MEEIDIIICLKKRMKDSKIIKKNFLEANKSLNSIKNNET